MDQDIRRNIEKDSMDDSGFGCMYIKPGNALNIYLKCFLLSFIYYYLKNNTLYIV